MTLRKKTLLVIGAMGLCLILILYFVAQGILLGGFVDLEKRSAYRNTERVLNALSTEISDIKGQAQDWATWDDTYAFIVNQNDEYIKANLLDGTFRRLRLNLIMFIDSSGRIVFGKAYDLVNGKEIPVPVGMERHLAAGTIATHANLDSSVIGVILLPENPMLVASFPISTSEHKGPIRGALIMGRYLDSAEVGLIGKITRLSLVMYRFGDSQSPRDFQEASSALSNAQPIFVRALSEQSIAGYTLLTDIYGEPSLVLRADMPRDIYGGGRTAVAYLLLSVVIIGLLFGVATVLLLEKQVLLRLERLTTSVLSIGVSGSVSKRVVIEGKDELAHLAATINGMLSVLQESEVQLRESKEMFEKTFNSQRDAIFILNAQKPPLITDCNPAAARIFGYTQQQLLGHSTAFLHVNEGELAIFQEYLDDAMAKQGFLYLPEFHMKRSDGTVFPTEHAVTALLDSKGVRFGWVSVVHDITERKQAEEKLRMSEEYFRSLIENSLDAVVIMNTDGKVRYASPALKTIFGYEPGMVIGKSVLEFINPDDMSMATGTFDEGLRKPGQVLSRELRVKHRDGSWRFVEIRGKNAVDNPAVNGVIFNIQDITERKQAEEELQRHYELEKELRQEVQAEMDRRVEFTRALVHELKTPLTPVMASSELLVDELKQDPWLRLARNVNRGAVELNRRIDELLDLARGEIGMLRLNVQSVDTLKLLREVVSNMTPLASGKKQALRSELPSSLPLIMADGDRLRQVVLNLVGNAVKFTPVGGRITIKAKEEEGNVVVEIQDTGIGISEEEQKRLFHAYHRLERDRERLSGLGLGLALSKRLVELHGGKIWLKSQRGEGSVFGFSIPIRQESQTEKSDKAGGKL